jgi:alginate O-acetyltransferase complex protein AlgI
VEVSARFRALLAGDRKRAVVFSSIEFLWFFMPVVLLLYAVVPPRGRNPLLAAVSIVFYAWGARGIVFVFLASTIFNYLMGPLIGRLRTTGRGPQARRVMWTAVVVNVAILFTWKYAVFATSQIDHLLGWFGARDAIPLPSILLPIGISFFTFHAISYVVDTTRGEALRCIDCVTLLSTWLFPTADRWADHSLSPD